MIPAALLLSVLCLCAQAGPEETVPRGDTLKAAGITSGRLVRSALDSGAPVLDVSAAAIVRSGARDLHEVLRTLPGLTLQDYGGIGGLKTVSVRGLGAAHTAVSEDGFLVRDAQRGSIDISQWDLEHTGHIRVETGAPDDIFKSASAFSSGAVLEVRSLRPDFGAKKTVSSASCTAGSFHTWRPTFRIDHQMAPRWSITATGSWLSSKGNYPYTFGSVLKVDPVTGETTLGPGTLRREGSDVSTLKAGLRLDGETSRGGQILSDIRFTHSDRGLPGAAILYAQHPTERLLDRSLRARGSYERSQEGGWRLRVGASWSRACTRYTDTSAVYPVPVDDRYLLQSVLVGGILQRTLAVGDASRLVFALSEDMDLAHLDANTEACPQPSRLGSVTALSAQFVGERLKATASLTALLQREWIASPTSAHDAASPSRHRLSPALSLSYAVGGGLRLRLFVKEGYRVPTFNDLYYDRVGSISLVPEKAFQTGAGATWQHRVGPLELFLTADCYHNRVRDKIVAVPTLFVWRMRNLGEVQMDGMDLTASAVLPLGGGYTLRSDASWSFLRAVDVSDPSAKNYRHQIQYTPRNSGALTVSVDRDGLVLSYSLCAVGKRWYLPENTAANALPAYGDHSLALRRSFRVRNALLTLSGEALNLAGVNYEIVRSYPMPGRQLRVGMKVNF